MCRYYAFLYASANTLRWNSLCFGLKLLPHEILEKRVCAIQFAVEYSARALSAWRQNVRGVASENRPKRGS